MLNQNKRTFFICFVMSLVVHFLCFFIVFYHKQSKQVFLQIPIEVSFYSPSQEFKKKSTVKIEKPIKKIEKKVERKKEVPKKEKKEDVVVKSEKKEEEKTVKENAVSNEQEKENKTEQTQQNVSSFMPNKGIMLENADFKYSYYTTGIVKKISRYWQWSSTYSSYRAVVYFRIERDGFVKSVEIKESSGDEGFDENAVRAVKLASPFAPLPDGYTQDHLGVYFEFKFR